MMFYLYDLPTDEKRLRDASTTSPAKDATLCVI